MSSEVFFEIHQDLPREGLGRERNRYTRKAFRRLPKLEKTRILDIGCGPGGRTPELARLSSGQIVGIDSHQPFLDRLDNSAPW